MAIFRFLLLGGLITVRSCKIFLKRGVGRRSLKRFPFGGQMIQGLGGHISINALTGVVMSRLR